MSCNCPDTNKCPTPTTCLCGLETNIYNPSGVLVETVTAYPIDVEGTTIYQIFNSTAFEATLGQAYTLTISYNIDLERWEITYFNDDLNLTILLGVLYGVEPDSCPVNNCWDLDCNAVAFRVLGAFDTYFSWVGDYTNGKKSYEFTSDWSGSDVDYRVYWVSDSSVFPGSDAPVGTPAWVLEEEVGPGVWQPAGYLFNNNKCPYGVYLARWNDAPSRFSFTDLGVTGFDLKTSILDCGCCDTEVIITIDGEEYTATVEYDEYGNILVYNGVNYYTFTIGENTYYIFYLNGQWVIKEELSQSAETIYSLTSTNECPFGFYSVNQTPESCDCIKVTYQLVGEEPVTVEVETDGQTNGKNQYRFGFEEVNNIGIIWDGTNWIVIDVNSEEILATLSEDTPCPFGTYTIEEGSIFESFVVSECDNQTPESCDCISVTYQLVGEEPVTVEVSYDTEEQSYLYFINGNFSNIYYYSITNEWISYSDLGTGATLSQDTDCPFGTYTIEEGSIFESFVVSECDSPANIIVSVKGAECFDCCDYDTPKNRNLLKKKKAIFVEEISSIRSKEIFGFKCGPEWDDLFKKHLIFDVLWCLPYGKICDEEQQCLINNLNENCNC